MEKTNTPANRLVALILSLVIVLGMFTFTVIASDNSYAYGTVEGLSEGISVSGDGAEIAATFAGSLNWVAADASIGRTKDGWWVGIQVNAPESVDLEKAQFTLSGVANSFNENKDSEDDAESHYICIWKYIDAEKLRAANLDAGIASYEYTFDWDGDNVFEQKVYLKVDASQTILYNNDSTKAYPATELGYGKVNLLTEGANITSNESAAVFVAYNEDITIDWVAADTSIGRYQDGWWVGIQISAPAGMTEDQLKNAQLKLKSGVISFWDNKDTQEGTEKHWISIWVPLNDLLSGSMENRNYQFDWNNDGLFEQKVALSVDSSKITLTKNGVQVYPVLGQVSSYSGGTVSGSGTGVVNVLIDDVTLDWAEADSTIGRAQGWWAGIRVEAPSSCDAAMLRNAKLQVRRNEGDSWDTAEVLSFWDYKDSADDASVHHVGLWLPVSPSIVAEHAAEGKNITRWYRFDWDNDGTYEQELTFSIDPSGNIVLNKIDQTGFGFESTNPVDQWIGNTYKNEADGGQTEETIIYEIVDGPATIAADGTVTFTGLGAVTVKATRPGNDFYKDVSATYVVTSVKNEWEPFGFTISNPTITYAPNLNYPNANLKNDLVGLNNTVTFAIVNGEDLVLNTEVATIDPTTGVLTVLKSGIVTVRATRSADSLYTEATAEYTVTIEKASQNIAFETVTEIDELTYQTEAINLPSITGKLSEMNIVYAIIVGDGEVAEIDENGQLQLLMAGNFEMTVVVPTDDRYKESNTLTWKVKVNKANQTGFDFAADSDTVTYNDVDKNATPGVANEYTMITNGGQSSGTVTYEVVREEGKTDEDYPVDFEISNSVLKILRSGTVTIKATKAGDDQYNAAVNYFELTVEKDEQEYSLNHSGTISLKYGTLDYTNVVVAGTNVSIENKPVYAIDENNIGADIDSKTGNVTFSDSEGKVGKVTVSVTVAADDCYNAYSASYELDVAYLETDATPTTDGESKNTSGWYTDKVVIKAPTGYTVAYDNKLGTEWKAEIPYAEEGVNNATVFLKDTDGYITDKITVADIKMDKSAPTDLDVSYDLTIWETILGKIFGFKSTSVKATLSAKDSVSGIDFIEYSTDGVNFTPIQYNGEKGISFNIDNIDPQYRNKVTFKVTDIAGHATEYVDADDRTVVVDSIRPIIINEKYNFTNNQHNESNNIYYTNGNVNIELVIKEANFDLAVEKAEGETVSKAPVVLVNGVARNVTWTRTAGTDEWKGTIDLEGEGDYIVKVDFTDRAENKMITFEKEIHIDNTAPVRVVTPSTADGVVSNETLKNIDNYTYSAESTNAILYYKDKATVKFEVTEANFYKEDVHVLVNGTETNPTNWEFDEKNNWWVGTITLTDEGDYIVEMNYTDKSGNEMPAYKSERIVIDHNDPTISVSYADNKNYVHEINGREYYNANRTATIEIKEHNFRADDVKVIVYAKDIVDENITPVGTLTFGENGIVNEYFNDGCDREEWSAYKDGTWRRDNDTFKLVLEYTEDANYTFDIAYTDLANRSAAEYEDEFFTVDKTKPECVEVAYSTNVFENILEDVTFGYYNAQMTVTITAQDDISGVYHFVYSYLKGANVSSVNAQLIDEAISNAEITYDGKTAIAEFKIPKLALNDDNQFNGIIEFTAYDRSENVSKKFTDESTVIVVDNIKPTSQVTFNDPIQKVNGISYYADDINATIVVNEANFYSKDVVVTVTKDDKNYPVNVKWTDDASKPADNHIGTFILTEDGDYIVNVTYADRSKNEMTPYVSNQLTIDTKDPVINVSNVKHQSANNDETISFTVSVTDTNIALDSFKPILNAVIKTDNGNNNFAYETKAIDLGDAITTTNADGETVYSYTVNNLEVDGYYSLVCTAVDYANHSVSVINSAADEGGNTTVETMNFSVNREGSVFWLETEHNDKYTGETFTDKLNGAYANDKVNIKLHEINVDKVNENSDKRTVFTLNDGSESEDIELKENDNYSKNVIVGTGGWYETIYTLDNDNFDHDGVYSLNVITYDKADNSNVNTKTEAGTISFTLDRTNPVISANIKNDQSINDTQFWVEFEITETNLDAETIVVKLTNNDGKTVETEVENLGNNEYKFLVESGYNYSVEIVARDLAGNESELYKVEHLTVSTNILFLWYANTPLFWGSIGGTVLLAGIIVLLIFLKKRKKNAA